MVQSVAKRDGSVQPFDVEKMKNSVRAAARDAGLEEERINEIVEQVVAAVLPEFENQEQVSFSDIRRAVLSQLGSIAPEAVEAWKKHEREVKALPAESTEL